MSALRIHYERPERNPLPGRILATASIPVALLLYSAALKFGAIDGRYFPSLSRIFAEFSALISSGEAYPNMLVSAERVLLGWFIGAPIGLAFACLASASRLFRPTFDFWMAAFWPIPKIALFPLFILWLGLGEAPKVVLMALGALLLLAAITDAGLKNVDQNILDAAMIDGARPMQTVLRVALPIAMPVVFDTLKKILVNWTLPTLISAEMILSNEGLGFLIATSFNNILVAKFFAVLLLIVALAFALQGVVALAEKVARRFYESH